MIYSLIKNLIDRLYNKFSDKNKLEIKIAYIKLKYFFVYAVLAICWMQTPVYEILNKTYELWFFVVNLAFLYIVFFYPLLCEMEEKTELETIGHNISPDRTRDKKNAIVYPVINDSKYFADKNNRYFDFTVKRINYDKKQLKYSININKNNYPFLEEMFDALDEANIVTNSYKHKDNRNEIYEVYIHESTYEDLVLYISHYTVKEDGSEFDKNMIEHLCEFEKLLLIFPNIATIYYE